MSVNSKQFKIIFLLFVAFWFRGNTLFWITDPMTVNSKASWSKLQFDHKDPPTINQEPIRSIKVTEKEVFIIAGDKCWILHYEDLPEKDWYIEDPFPI